jgi:hypothetical protein
MTKRAASVALLFFVLCLLVYSLTAFGGFRSPDAEMIYRVGESLAEGRGFAVEEIEIYPGFGAARGRDGRLYSIYPPVESLAIVPVIGIAEALNRTAWYEGHDLPLSHYVDNGLWRGFLGQPAGLPEAHASRFIVSFFNVLVSALCVSFFFLVAERMLRSPGAAAAAAGLYAFGTLAWHYSGTMFSEPLAVLFVLVSFYFIVLLDERFGGGAARITPLFISLSGLCLGIAAATHMTSLLFLPFFYLYARSVTGGRREGRSGMAPSTLWLLAVAAILALLGWYNFARFGSLLESGRALSGENPVFFHYPWTSEFWRGLYGLFLGGGKGLLLFCPAVLLAASGWRALYRKSLALAVILGSAILFRLLFVASYYDWHGGFCLGPRYLLPAVPFLILPFGFWVRELLYRGRWRRLAAAAAVGWLAASQQLYFALGEIFRYYHAIKLDYLDEGLDIFAGDRLYLDWSLSPLFHLLEQPRGAFFLGAVPLSNHALWAVGSLALLAITAVAFAAARPWRRGAGEA